MTTHIFEQDQDGMIEEVKQIFLVRQTQPDEEYYQTTIYVCSKEDEAIRRARELNKRYGCGCIFSDEGDFEEVDYDDSYVDGVHYYDVESMTINEQFK